MSLNGLKLGLTNLLCSGLGGGTSRQVSSAPSIPTTDLIQSLPYPNQGTLPTWKATVGGDATCNAATTDSGTGLIFVTSAQYATLSTIGPTANKPFTFVRVVRIVASGTTYVINTAGTSYFASFLGPGGSIFILSLNGGSLGSYPTCQNASGYAVERIRRNTAGSIYYQTTGQAEVLVAAGAATYTFPFDQIQGNNNSPLLSHFLYSGDNGDLTESGKWSELAAWITANNFGASL